MKILMRFAVLFYVTLVLFLGAFLLLFGLQWIDIDTISQFLWGVYFDQNLRMVFMIMSGIFLFINFLFYRLCGVNIRRDKIIAFDNPDGRVSVALVALEDSAKRAVLRLDEVRDVKIDMEARRKKLKCRVKLSLAKEENIPDLSSRIQMIIKNKIQDAIGLEDVIDISVYVSKFVPAGGRIDKGKDDGGNQDLEPNIPFRGYRA